MYICVVLVAFDVMFRTTSCIMLQLTRWLLCHCVTHTLNFISLWFHFFALFFIRISIHLRYIMSLLTSSFISLRFRFCVTFCLHFDLFAMIALALATCDSICVEIQQLDVITFKSNLNSTLVALLHTSSLLSDNDSGPRVVISWFVRFDFCYYFWFDYDECVI